MYGDYSRDVMDGVGFLKFDSHDDDLGDILINLDYITSIIKFRCDRNDFPERSGCYGFMVSANHLKRDDDVFNFYESCGYFEHDTEDSFIEKNLVVMNEDKKVYAIIGKTGYRWMGT